MVPNELVRVARIARVLIDAALANRDIQAHIADPRPPRLWTVEGVKGNPPVRVEWEHTVVIGGIGESLAAARHKSWGPLIGVLPLQPHDPVHWCRILYLYKDSSPYNRRFEQRQALKRILGRHHRPLVTRAAGSTKRDFLAWLTKPDTAALNRRLHLDPGQFWRAAKGHVFLELPKPPVQLLLFTNDTVNDDP